MFSGTKVRLFLEKVNECKQIHFTIMKQTCLINAKRMKRGLRVKPAMTGLFT
jgi:hypothetical protein